MRSSERNDAVVVASLMRREGYTGVQAHARWLTDGIAAEGLPTELVTPFSGTKLWYPVFAVRPLGLRRLNRNWSTRWHRYWHYVAQRRNLRRRLADRHTSALIAIDPLSARAALETRDDADGGMPIAFTPLFTLSQGVELRDQGELDDAQTERAIWDVERDVIEQVDLVIHNSEWQQRTLEVTRGLHPRRSVVVWHGIPETVATIPLDRAQLGLGPDDVVLVNVGSLEPRKNQLGLLDLFAAVAREHPRAMLLIVGHGPLRRAIESRIAELGLGERVKLLGAWPDVPAVLGISDVYIHYSNAESFGLAVVEAARASLPTVAIPVGGLAEVQRELGGLALPPDDVAASVALLQPLLSDEGLRVERGRHANERFRRSFTRRRMVLGHLEALGFHSPSQG